MKLPESSRSEDVRVLDPGKCVKDLDSVDPPRYSWTSFLGEKNGFIEFKKGCRLRADWFYCEPEAGKPAHFGIPNTHQNHFFEEIIFKASP